MQATYYGLWPRQAARHNYPIKIRLFSFLKLRGCIIALKNIPKTQKQQNILWLCCLQLEEQMLLLDRQQTVCDRDMHFDNGHVHPCGWVDAVPSTDG